MEAIIKELILQVEVEQKVLTEQVERNKKINRLLALLNTKINIVPPKLEASLIFTQCKVNNNPKKEMWADIVEEEEEEEKQAVHHQGSVVNNNRTVAAQSVRETATDSQDWNREHTRQARTQPARETETDSQGWNRGHAHQDRPRHARETATDSQGWNRVKTRKDRHKSNGNRKQQQQNPKKRANLFDTRKETIMGIFRASVNAVRLLLSEIIAAVEQQENVPEGSLQESNRYFYAIVRTLEGEHRLVTEQGGWRLPEAEQVGM